MKNATRLAGLFIVAAGACLGGCTRLEVPASTAAAPVTPVATVNVGTIGAAKIEAVTQIADNNLYEITPLRNKTLTCFISSTIYTGNAVSGSVDCVPKTAQTPDTKNAAATIDSATQIGDNHFYEITPATRSDVSCFVTATIYKGNAVSGSVRCLPKQGV